MINNLPQQHSRLGLCQTYSINSLHTAELGLYSDNNDCSKRLVCDVKFPKYDFGCIVQKFNTPLPYLLLSPYMATLLCW